MASRPTALFLIRDKLGDSLIAANVALLFARRHPEWQVSVMIRKDYACTLAHEHDVEVIAYGSGGGAMLRAWWWRLLGRRFAVVGVMRGFGKRTAALVRRLPALRRIAHDARLAEAVTEVVSADTVDQENDPHHGPAWRVARAIDPQLPPPDRLHFPGLAAAWQALPKRQVVICPLSDERRRNIPATALELLYRQVCQQHPEQQVMVLVRSRDDLAQLDRLPEVPIQTFSSMSGLLGIFMQSSHFYGTDTGLLHLALAMGMPCDAFFGPTQMHRVLPSGQTGVRAWRDGSLGTAHCDIKACTHASCIARAVAQFAGQPAAPGESLRSDCPLR